ETYNPGSLQMPARCAQCGHCIGNCPQKIVLPGIAGYPAVDFNRRARTFCGAWAESCTLGCFARRAWERTPDRSLLLNFTFRTGTGQPRSQGGKTKEAK